MTVYILGGSNTAMNGGWTDYLAIKLYRRTPVQNLSLGATNSNNALARILTDVDLRAGDVVVWTNAPNDALAMSVCNYPVAMMLDYVEAIIIRCREVGAQFVPVVFDTFIQHVMVQNPEWPASLERLMAHYSLPYVNLTTAYRKETGEPFVPRRFYLDVLHLAPNSELCQYLADISAEVIAKDDNYPADVPRLFLSNSTQFEVITGFTPEGQAESFKNAVLASTGWAPPVVYRRDTRAEAPAWLDAMTLLADPNHGRFRMTCGTQTVDVSATHDFGYNKSRLALTVCAPFLSDNLKVDPGAEIRFDWCEDQDTILADLHFKQQRKEGEHTPSRARVLSLLLRTETKAGPGVPVGVVPR